MEEVVLIDSCPTNNSGEQGEPAATAKDEVPLSRWGRDRVIIKNIEEEQKEVDKAGSCTTPDQVEFKTTITCSSGATDNHYNAGYDQMTRYGKIPKSSGQERDQGDPVRSLYGVVKNQPYAPTTVDMGATPPDYLQVSVLTSFCCFITGLCAVYYAYRRNALVAKGDMFEATRMSNNARNLIIVTVVLGVIIIAFSIIRSVLIMNNKYIY